MSNQTFTFGSNLKKWILGLTVVGLVLGLAGAFFIDDAENHRRFWSNLLLNTYYFAGISVTGLFFIAAHQLGYGGWHTVFKKIPIAMGRFLYVVFFLMLIIVAGMWLTPEGLYSHWADPHHVDSIVAGKAPFLTRTSFTIGVLSFYGLWALFAFLLSKNFISIKNWKEYAKSKKIAAAFLLVFGVSSSILSWWVIMSLDPHWYSTLFGWYNMASYFCAGFAMMILILIALKKMGHLPHVGVDHIHDLGKFMFGFSIFWTYLMFSQFMLIWYANIPEATIWFNKRFDIPFFKIIFFLALLINFVLPLLAILKRESKRKMLTMAFVSVMLIFGHYLDFYHMVMVEPMAIEHGHHGEEEEAAEEHATLQSDGNVLYAEVAEPSVASSDSAVVNDSLAQTTVAVEEAHTDATNTSEEAHVDVVPTEAAHGEAHGEEAPLTHAKLGLIELLVFVGFLGLFLFMTFSGLDGQELEVKEDPYLEESLHHHI